MTTQKIKVYELAKELGVESIALVERLKQLDIDVKSHMSALGSEETRIAREHFAKEKALADKVSKSTSKKASPSTVEKRVTSTVIRRRSKSTDGDAVAEEAPKSAKTAAEDSSAAEAAAKTKVIRRPSGKTAKAEAAEETLETPPKAAEPAEEKEETLAAAPQVEAEKPTALRKKRPVEKPKEEVTASTKDASPQAPAAVEETPVPVATVEAAPVEAPVTREPVKAQDSEPSAAVEAVDTSPSEAPAEPQAALGTSEATASSATPTSKVSFDIIKVVPKGPATDAPRPSTQRIVTTPTGPQVTRPSVNIQITQKAVPGAPPPVRPLRPGEGPRPGFGRSSSSSYGTYRAAPFGTTPGQGNGFPNSGPRQQRSGSGFPGSEGGGFRPGGTGILPFGGVASALPILPAGSRHMGHDKPRDFNFDDDANAKKKGLGGRGVREETPVDVKLTDYRAKKELIFIGKKKKVPLDRALKSTQITKPAAHKRVIKLEGAATVADFANRMGIKASELIKKLMGMGVMAGMNHAIDIETAILLAPEFGFEVENIAFKEDNVLNLTADVEEDKQPRPPIVTVMGHVDHGKTSLLDAIRQTNVVAGEAGGITQHIGAYSIEVEGDRKITFIDTPGHEAFTMMRARGANVTDIVILVVAADDGIMPQTREAIDHARSAGVPIIVAINKIDKPTANRDRILQQLAEADLLAEEWGGQIMTVNVSALKRTGIKELLEAVLLQAEVLDLKANPERRAEGTILEAKLDRFRGPVATLLLKRGSLSVGDVLVAGMFTGRVKAMVGAHGEALATIGPSMAAEVLGLSGVPIAGDQFNGVENDGEAQELLAHRAEEIRKREAAKGGKLSLEQIFSKIQKGDLKELPLIMKSDVYGSAEALKESLNKLSTDKVKVKILASSVGGISESDILLASASNALILGFNVRPDTKALALAERENVEVKTYSIIYELIDDVKKAMVGLLPKQAVERYLGRAEARNIFSIPSIGVIAGCSVIDGKIVRNANVRLLRENRVVYTGKLGSLRRFKDDAKEVQQGFECGIGIENYRDIKLGDVIEAYTIDMVAQGLEALDKKPTEKADKKDADQDDAPSGAKVPGRSGGAQNLGQQSARE